MKDDLSTKLKDFYIKEVSSMSIPPVPADKKSNHFKKDNFLLAVCIAAAFLLIVQPGLSVNILRKTTISTGTCEMLKDNFSRVIFDASHQYKSNKGVNYD